MPFYCNVVDFVCLLIIFLYQPRACCNTKQQLFTFKEPSADFTNFSYSLLAGDANTLGEVTGSIIVKYQICSDDYSGSLSLKYSM